MKRIYTLLFASLLAFAFSGGVFAQEGAEEEQEKRGKREKAEKPEKPAKVDSTLRNTFGVYANFHSGMTFGNFGKLQNDLRPESVFSNEDFTLAGLGSSIGGSAHLLLFKRLMIGGGATRYAFDASLSERPSPEDTAQYNSDFQNLNRGEAKITTTLYNIQLGFAAINREHHLLIPFVGYSFGESKLDIKNYSPDIMQLGGAEIDRARRETYTSNIGVIDFGVGYRYLMKRGGGLMLGAELGGYINIQGNEWENSEGVALQDVNDSSLMGGYLRFTVGGGIFGTNAAKLGIPPVEKKPKRVKKPKREKDSDTEAAE